MSNEHMLIVRIFSIFWWPAGVLLIAAWMAFTEYFVRSQHVPVLTDTFGSSQGTLLQASIIAALTLSS